MVVVVSDAKRIFPHAPREQAEAQLASLERARQYLDERNINLAKIGNRFHYRSGPQVLIKEGAR